MTSLTDSVYSYVYENGRTYQAYRPETYVCIVAAACLSTTPPDPRIPRS